MNINALVENFYSKKDDTDQLVEEVLQFLLPAALNEDQGAKARDRVIRLPNLMATEITVGQKPGSEERKQFELWMSNIGLGGGSGASAVSQKLTAITNFFKDPEKNLSGATIPETLSYLMFLNQFVYMLKEFNASVAGFLWEPFLASLFGGKSEQVPTSRGDIADIRIWTPGKDGAKDAPISLKILNEAGEVKGSFFDLVNHFAEGGSEMRYIIVVKDQSAVKKQISAVTFYEFNITAQSFFDWIGTVKYEEVGTLLAGEKFTIAGGGGKNVVTREGPEVLDKGERPPGNGGWVWIRTAKQEGRGKVQVTKWYRLGELVTLDDGTQALRVPVTSRGIKTSSPEGKTIKALNIQGISDALEGDLLPLDAPLTADVGKFLPGGHGGARPKATYQKQAAAADGLLGIGGKDTQKLWGGVENLSQWSALRDQLIEEFGPQEGSARLFRAIRDGDEELGVKRAPGASGKGAGAAEEGSGTQFHISPKHYKGLGSDLGTLRITEKEVVDFFKTSAENMNEELVIMFNKLADLNDNIGRFFLSSCGDGKACTEKDEARRTEAGQAAINDSQQLEAAVVKSVSGMK